MLNTEWSISIPPSSKLGNPLIKTDSPHLYFEKMNYMLLFSELVGNNKMPECELFPENDSNKEENAKKIHFLETLHRKLSSESNGSSNKPKTHELKPMKLKDNFRKVWNTNEGDQLIDDLIFQLKKRVIFSF